jgi:IclR family transcriptional regulator, KDG regulon repressor
MTSDGRTTTKRSGPTKSLAKADSTNSSANTRDGDAVAVARAVDLLEGLARLGPANIAEIAEEVGCTRTICTRLLRVLEGRGFAIHDDTRNIWSLGARWNVLSRAAAEQGALAATAMPILVELGKSSGENVYLQVRDGMESETVAIYQTDPSLRLYSEVGKRRSLHAGSSRLLLAHAPEAVQTQVLAQRLPRFTPATRTDPAWIAADLHRIRARGYLVTSDEVVAGAVSVGAPVRDTSGQVVASLYVGAPSMRMRPPRPRAMVNLVREAANRLSMSLGAPDDRTAVPPTKGEATHQPWTLGKSANGGGSAPHSIFR